MFETFTTAMILLLCWLTLAVADFVVSGVVSLCAGVAFWKVFLWGLVSLVIHTLAVA